WCAAMPMPMRSSDSSISRACCLVSAKIYSLLPLKLYSFGLRGGPVDCACLRDEAELGGVLEIKFEAAAIFRVERKVDVVAQIGFKRALGQFQILSRFIADFAEMRKAEIARSQKVRGKLLSGQFVRHRPDRE